MPVAPSDLDERLGDMRPWLVLLARMHLNDGHRGQEASDIAQEALIDAVKYREKIAELDLAELEYWLRRVLRNKVIDCYRKKRPEMTAADLGCIEADVGDSFLRIDEMIADKADSPSGQANAHEEQMRLAAAIDQLPEDYREVVLLRDLSGWGLKETAEKIDCSIGVVAGRLRRARAMLLEFLEPNS